MMIHNSLKNFCAVLLLLLYATECDAAVTFEWFRPDSTYDNVVITNYQQQATVTLVNVGNNNYNSTNVTSIDTVTPAILRPYNTESSAIFVSTNFTSVNLTLQCLAQNCTTAAQSCNVTFAGNNVGGTGGSKYVRVAKNGRGTLRMTGVLTIPANCGAGTFTGVGSFTPKYGTSSSSMNTSGPTVSFNIIASINSSAASHSVSISSEQDLDFGTMISNTSSSHQVTVSTAGIRTPTNYTIGNDAHNGIINVDNLGSSAFAANVSVSSSVTMYRSGTSNPMTATLTPSSSGSVNLSPGNNYINIGGTLTVPAGQPAGDYNGTYSVTVTYD